LKGALRFTLDKLATKAQSELLRHVTKKNPAS